MRTIGCDLHAAQQTIAILDRDTGEIVERTLPHDGTGAAVRHRDPAPRIRADHPIERRTSPPPCAGACYVGCREDALAVAARSDSGRHRSAPSMLNVSHKRAAAKARLLIGV